MIGRADDPLNPFNAPPPISHDFIAASIRRTKDHLSRIRHHVFYLSFCLTYVLISIIKKRIRIFESALILAYTQARVCVYICKYPFVCVSALILAYTHTHTKLSTYTYMRSCIHAGMCVYLYARAHTHTEALRVGGEKRVGARQRQRQRGHKAQRGSYFNMHMH